MAEQRWDYRVISEKVDTTSHDTGKRSWGILKDQYVESTLNKWAAEGWELVTAVATERGEGLGLRFIFKRPKEE